MSTIPFDSVKRNDRVRVDYGDIESLATSIYTYGLIHPIAIDGAHTLIAGGRRSAALEYLLRNTPAMFEQHGPAHESMASFLSDAKLVEGVHYHKRPVLTYDTLGELEIIENVERKNFTWQEEVLGIRKVHLARKKAAALQSDKWGQQQTARLMKVSLGNVNYCLVLGAELDDPESPLWEMKSLSEGLQHLAKKKLDKANKLLAEKTIGLAKEKVLIQAPDLAAIDESDDGFFSTIDAGVGSITGIDIAAIAGGDVGNILPEGTVAEEQYEAQMDRIYETVARIANHCRAEELLFDLLDVDSVDHIITDPPYAIEMENISSKDVDRVEATHDVASNLKDFGTWLEGCARVVRPGGFIIWFCDYMHFRTIHDIALSLNLRCQRWPFVWIKTSACRNQAPDYNFTKNHECAIVMRHANSRLPSPVPSSYWMGALEADDKDTFATHPFTKPAKLWQHLMRQVAREGQTICDPFAGAGSMPRAALLGGFVPITSEIETNYYNYQVNVLVNTYKKLYGLNK